MGTLDKMIENQQTEKGIHKQSKDSTILYVISTIYKWLGGLLLIVGLILFCVFLNGEKDKFGVFAVSFFFGGLFLLFGGCIGEAIDDIRDSVRKHVS